MEKLKGEIAKVMRAAGFDMVGIAHVGRFTGAPEAEKGTGDEVPVGWGQVVRLC